MKNSTFSFMLFSLLISFSTQAQVNYSEHIAPIIYDNCTTCHRAGEIGPMPFTSYEEVAAWGGMIQYVTEIKYMPPFPPDVNYASYVGERYLTEDEIQLIADWVAAGTPQGNPDLEPPLPTFPTGSQVGVPDVVLEMSESYTIEGNNQDDYRVFVLPSGFMEDKEIAAIEFRPGNARAVHHALIAYDVTGEAAALDAQTPEYGYESFGDFGFDESNDLTWGYVPGTTPLVYPEGIGEIIPAGADILIQVHYAPLPTDETDQSSINIFFKDSDDQIERPVKIASVSPFNLPGGWNSFQIPADEITTFVAESVYDDESWFPGIDEDISLISVDPHSHYLGKSYEIFAVTPQNDTINIINIEDWDFNWQGSYTFDRMKKIPANSEWFTIAAYDNTTMNPYNPSNPPIDVSWGEGTQDEMLLVGLYYVPYQEGDEDIVIGDGGINAIFEVESPTQSKLLPPSPNPTNNEFAINFQLEQREKVVFELTQMDGKLVQEVQVQQEWTKGKHAISMSAAGIAPGIYLIRMSGEGYVLSQKLIITH